MILFLPLTFTFAENIKPPVSLPEIIRSGDVDALSKLLKQNRELANTAITDSGFRPLHLCAGHNHSDMAKALIKAKADLNPTNNAGLTPLHVAAMRGAMETGSELVKRNAELNPKAHGGLTPLHLALRGGHEIMVERLVEWGADPALGDDEGVTPQQWAQENSLTNMVAIIQEAAKRRDLWLWEVNRNQTTRDWHAVEREPFDTDNSGNVDVDKLGAYRDARVERRHRLQDAMAQWLLEKYDANGDGVIRVHEVPQIMADLYAVASKNGRGLAYQRSLHEVYVQYFDHDEDGWISPIEDSTAYRFLFQARQKHVATNKVINIKVRWRR